MASITLTPATVMPAETLVALLNRAFTGYSIPVDMALPDFAAMVARDDIDLAASCVAYVGAVPIGLALLAVRQGHDGPCARLAAMGVTPEHRRLGIARLLLRHIVDKARAGGSASLVLEVLETNIAARALYEEDGFEAGRRLLGFALKGDRLASHRCGAVSLRPAGRLEVLGLFGACLASEPPGAGPPWQLDAPALARFVPPTALYAVTISGEAAPVGYLVLGRERPSAHLIHLGIRPEWRRRGLATDALAAALDRHPDIQELYLPQLVPEASSLVPFLESLGAIRESQCQIEMVLELQESVH